MEVLISPGEDGLIVFSLHGEDGRLIKEQVENYTNYMGRRLWISPSMEFSIPGAAETTRLSVYTRDLDGRIIALNSVDIVLMQVGKDDINPSIITQEPYLIRYPAPAQTIQGGIVTVYGLARPVNSSPLIIEIVDDTGKVVGSTEFNVANPTGNLSHTPFVVDVPYSIQTATGARLSISQKSDNRIPGVVALSSMVIFLEP